MKIRVSEMKPGSEWEKFILTVSPQSYFQSSIWGNLHEDSGKKVWRYGLFEEGKLQGVFQVIKIPARRGTFLHIRHGPIFRIPSDAYIKTFTDSLRQIAQQEKAWFIRCSPLIEDTEANRRAFGKFGFVPSPIHRLDGEYCWVLDIQKSDPELLGGMRKSTRYDIRHAQIPDVEIIRSDNTAFLSVFMDLYGQTAKRQGFVPHADLEKEVQYFSREGKTLLLVGKYKNAPVSSAVIVFYGHQAIYRHGASVHSPVPVSHLIQWEAIREARKRSYSLYNFWGIADPDDKNHKWAGLTAFKTGFGGRKVIYMHAQDYRVSYMYYVTSGIERVRKLLQGY